MTGDEVADGISGNRRAYCPCSLGPSHEAGKILVGDDLAGGNAQECLPDLNLKIGALHVKPDRIPLNIPIRVHDLLD